MTEEEFAALEAEYEQARVEYQAAQARYDQLGHRLVESQCRMEVLRLPKHLYLCTRVSGHPGRCFNPQVPDEPTLSHGGATTAPW